MEWITKGLFVWSCLNNNGKELKFLKRIKFVHTNTVTFYDESTTQKHLLKPVIKWLKIEDYKPEGKVLCMNECKDCLIGYACTESMSCESDNEYMDDVTHWMPVPVFIEEDNQQ